MLQATVGSAFVLVLLAGSAPAPPPATQPAEPAPQAAAGSEKPAGTESPSGLGDCVLVVAGTGTKTANEGVNKVWHTMNSESAKELVRQLTEAKVPARLAVIPQETPEDKVLGQLALALTHDRCRQLLQFSHVLGGGSGPGAFFGFEATLMDVTETPTGFKLGQQTFHKRHTYPLNRESLRSVRTSDIASRFKADLIEAGVLPSSPPSKKAASPN